MNDIMTTEALPSQRFDIFTGILKAGGGDGEPMTLSGVASSSVEDLHGDTIERTALKDMEKQVGSGLTIFLNHSYQVPEDVAGYTDSARMRKRGEDGDGNAVWDLDMDISINDENPRAVEAWKGIRKKGAKVGLSIGANIPPGGFEVDRKTGAKTIKHINLLETSIVGIPANPRSWIAKALEILPREGDLDVSLALDEIEEAPPADDRQDEITVGEAGPEVVEQTSPDQPDTQTDDSTPDADPSDPGSEVTKADTSAEASGVPPLESDTAVVEAAIESLEKVEGEVNATHLQMAVDIGRALAEQLIDARKARDEALLEKAEADRERDETIERSAQILVQTSEIVEAVGNMPLGRKTFIKEAQRKLAHLDATYGPEFMKMLEK